MSLDLYPSLISPSCPELKQALAASQAEVAIMKKEESAALKAKSDEMTQLRNQKAESDKRYFTIVGNHFTCGKNMKESELMHFNNVSAFIAKLDISGNNKTRLQRSRRN